MIIPGNAFSVFGSRATQKDDIDLSPDIVFAVLRIRIGLEPYTETYPDNRGFSWHAKIGEKRKTSEEFVSKSC